MRLSEVLKTYMWAKHLSLRQMAREIGMDFTTLSRFINGKQLSFKEFNKVYVWLTLDLPKSEKDSK